MPLSPHTILRVVHQTPLPVRPTPRVLGGDDFAPRKRHTYGTLLVALEQRQPVDLLPARTAATLATWLNTTCGRAIEGTRVVTQAIRAGVPITLGVLAPELLARSGACEAAAVLRHERLAQRRRRGERGALRSVSSAPARPIAEHCCTRFGISTVRSCASSGCVARAPPQLYLTRGTTYQSPSGLAGTDAAPLNDCE
jgi:hypothetical protein